jgi:hypothetical protein
MGEKDLEKRVSKLHTINICEMRKKEKMTSSWFEVRGRGF